MSAYTQAQLDAIRAAYAKGVKSVSYDGNTVTYSSAAEMERIIANMERALNPGRQRVHYPEFTRGT